MPWWISVGLALQIQAAADHDVLDDGARCPESYRRGDRVPRGWKTDNTAVARRFHPGSMYGLRKLGGSTQCRYQGDGALIIEGLGAGTRDAKRGLLTHLIRDVNPFKAAACAFYRTGSKAALVAYVDRHPIVDARGATHALDPADVPDTQRGELGWTCPRRDR